MIVELVIKKQAYEDAGLGMGLGDTRHFKIDGHPEVSGFYRLLKSAPRADGDYKVVLTDSPVG